MHVGTIQPAGADPPAGLSIKAQLRKVVKAYPLLVNFLGARYEGETALFFCRKLRTALKLGPVDQMAVDLSVSAILTDKLELDKDSIRRVMFRVLVNAEYLQRGEVIPVWPGSPPVWTVIRAIGVDYEAIKERKYVRLTIKALANIVAGDTFSMLLPVKYVRWLAKEMGYPAYERAHEREIMGMASHAVLALNKHGGPTLSRVRPSSSQADANRKLARARLEKDCKHKTRQCWACPMGVDQCRLACRRWTELKQETPDDRGESSSSEPAAPVGP